MTDPGSESEAARCPSCRKPIRDTLRYERATALGASEGLDPLPMLSAYCGDCGTTLATFPDRPAPLGGLPRVGLIVNDPGEPTSLAGQFQLRCRALIEQIHVIGFAAGGWAGLINQLGAVGAAKDLLSTHRVLPVTPWLVQRERADLTMEHEVCEPRWAELFTDAERAEATRRLEPPT